MNGPTLFGQCVHNSTGVMFRRHTELSDGHFITAFLPFHTDLSIYPPDQWMEPVGRLGQHLKQIDTGVKTDYMTEFMCQDGSAMLGVFQAGKVIWEVNTTAK